MVRIFRVTVIQTGRDYGYFTAPDGDHAVAACRAQYGVLNQWGKLVVPGEDETFGGSGQYKKIGLVYQEITTISPTTIDYMINLDNYDGYKSVVYSGPICAITVSGITKYIQSVGTDTDGTLLWNEHDFTRELVLATDEAVARVSSKGEVKRGWGFY